MSFEALPVQQKLFDTASQGERRIIGFGGGIRGTKTWGSLALAVTLCRLFPRSRWAVVRKDLPRLRQNTLPSFAKLREEFGGFIGAVNQSTWTATCRNGSELIFFPESLDIDPDLSRWKGLEVNGFILEEADELSERAFIKAIERAGAWIVPNGLQPPPYIICTFNPCANWPKRVFYEPWKHGTLSAPYAFIPATQADNPYISPEQREAWKQMPPEEYRRFVEGDWDVLSGRYYDSLNPRVHLIPRTALPSAIPDWWECWGAYDWGYAHWSVFGSFCKDSDSTTYLLDSTWIRREQDRDQAKTIAKSVVDPRCLKLVYAGRDCWNMVTARGGSGETTADIFYAEGIYLTRADDDRINGGRALRRGLAVDGFGGTRFKMVDTPNNRRVFDQLADAMPDENNINKPAKADCDSEGRGGDDGADMCRYGVATRIGESTEPVDQPTAEPYQDPDVLEPAFAHVAPGSWAGQLPGDNW